MKSLVFSGPSHSAGFIVDSGSTAAFLQEEISMCQSESNSCHGVDGEKMDGFPLFDIPFRLLEKTASKFQDESYFYMQQTCRGMSELIQTSKNITTTIHKEAVLDWKRNDDGVLQLYVALGQYNCDTELTEEDYCIDIESLYGVRFWGLLFITGIIGRSPPKEQCIELLKVMKPYFVLMDSRGSNRFEALAIWTKWGCLSLMVSPEQDYLAAVRLFHKIKGSLEISSPQESEDFTVQQFFGVMNRIVELLLSECDIRSPTEIFRHFACHVLCDDTLRPTEEIVQQLNAFQPTFFKHRNDPCGLTGEYQCTGHLISFDLKPRGEANISVTRSATTNNV